MMKDFVRAELAVNIVQAPTVVSCRPCSTYRACDLIGHRIPLLFSGCLLSWLHGSPQTRHI